MSNKPPTRQGSLIVVSGPSGAGKTSVIDALLQSDSTLTCSVSATTRPPRPNETNGVNYHFLSPSEFETRRKKGEFVEWNRYGDYCYGTLKSEIESPLAEGKDLVFEIDVKGAMALRSWSPNIISIFILPPSFAMLERRLRRRQTESDPELQQRLTIARSEIGWIKDYDYCVINPDDEIDQTVKQIRHIISAERCRINESFLAWTSQEFSRPTS
ncbi:MAG: guanylate kinase [Candidatus Poribacteria bacterium]|nr:guanylate kinase [Candidatus Poribacteria bacterium]MDE0503191.1 guanylate kinase [Candidatus Poribacteria bacterium]